MPFPQSCCLTAGACRYCARRRVSRRGRLPMRTALACMFVVAMGTGLSIGCQKEAAPPPAPAASPPPAPPPAPVAAATGDGGAEAPKKPKMVAPTDGLSLADRMAKRQKEEKKLADENAAAENKRLLAYDKG